MRSVVALVRARPETILDDYRRVSELAGIENLQAEQPAGLWVAWGGGDFSPGFDSPCWQLAAAAGLVAGRTDRETRGTADTHDAPDNGLLVYPVGPHGVREGFPGGRSGWTQAVAQAGGRPAPEDSRRLRGVHPQAPLPALAAVTPQGFQMPTGWASSALILPTPVLNRGWQLAGAVALVAALGAGRSRPHARIPAAEVVAEALALALDQAPRLPTLMDGVVWGVHGQDGKPHGLVRNILLAGTDPLAVDAVAARLAGLDPVSIPWMELCAERGLGQCAPARLDIRGDTDLLDLDLEIPEVTFRTADSSRMPQGPRPAAALDALKAPGRLLGSLGKRNAGDHFAECAWGNLQAACVAGSFPGRE